MGCSRAWAQGGTGVAELDELGLDPQGWNIPVTFKPETQNIAVAFGKVTPQRGERLEGGQTPCGEGAGRRRD